MKYLHTLKISFILIFLFYSCGFKPLDYQAVKELGISEISTEGNKNINFILVNDLKQLFSDNINVKKQIKIDIDTKEEKRIREKNKKNEITKYEISIKTKLSISSDKDNLNFSIDLEKKGEYQVDQKNIKTIQNEKKARKDIVSSLSNEIFEQILLKLNDL